MTGIYATLQRRRLWLLFVCFFLMMAAVAILSPHLTPLAVDYFASASGGVEVSCGDYTAGEAPLACTHGSTIAVRYVSVTSFFSNAVLGLLISPVVGWLSDSYGRKPFFLAALVLNAIPFVWIAAYLHMQGTISFVGYYVMEGLKGMVVPLSLVMSSTADVAEPGLRATLFSLIMVELSIAMILAAGVGGLLSATASANTSVVLFTVSIILYASFMPETLTDEAVAIHTKSSPTAPLTISSSFQTLLGGLKESLSVLTRSQLFFKLALIMAATGIVFECIMDLLFNYLILTMGFGASQISNVLMVLGICGLFVQGLLLPALLKVVPEKWILVGSLIASAFEMVGLVIAPALGAWAVYLSMIVGAPGSMSFPVISALKSVHAGPDEQGKVQGALFAARGVAQGCGPLLFSAMFNFFTKEAHYFPGAPILGLAIIMVLGAAVGCSVKIPPVPPTNTALQHTVEAQDEELSQFQQDQRVALLHSDVEFKHHSDTPPSLEVGHN